MRFCNATITHLTVMFTLLFIFFKILHVSLLTLHIHFYIQCIKYGRKEIINIYWKKFVNCNFIQSTPDWHQSSPYHLMTSHVYHLMKYPRVLVTTPLLARILKRYLLPPHSRRWMTRLLSDHSGNPHYFLRWKHFVPSWAAVTLLNVIVNVKFILRIWNKNATTQTRKRALFFII